jgi:spore maturation protein CgeB
MKNKSLKILLVMGSAAAPVPNSAIFKDNIYESLIALGHKVTIIQFDDFLKQHQTETLENQKKVLEEHIIKICKQEAPFDYFLGFLSDEQVTPNLYKELKSEVFTVNWSCNSHQFDILHKEISPFVGLNTYIWRDHKTSYDSVGAKSYWLPMAANENLYKPSETQDITISFVGSAYGKRPYYVWRLLQSGVGLNLFGPGWKFSNNFRNLLRLYVAPFIYNLNSNEKRLYNLDKSMRALIQKQIMQLTEVGGVPDDKNYRKILSRSLVSLNFPESRKDNDFLNHEVNFGCNFRDFEIPLSRSMLLTQDSEEFDFFYERGREAIPFGNETDLIEKAKYYSNNVTEAKKISEAGYRRALNDHTWSKRFNQLFNYLK